MYTRGWMWSRRKPRFTQDSLARSYRRWAVHLDMRSPISLAVRWESAKVGNRAQDSARVAVWTSGAAEGTERHTKFMIRGSAPGELWDRTRQMCGESTASILMTTRSPGSIISRGTTSKSWLRRAAGPMTTDPGKIRSRRRTSVSPASCPATRPPDEISTESYLMAILMSAPP